MNNIKNENQLLIMKKYLIGVPFLVLIFIFSSSKIYPQSNLSYFLSEEVTYDESIPTPASVVGHKIGDWHISHDKLINYFLKLGESSDKVQVEQFGQTYENRPLLNVIITSKKNHEKLEQIRTEHLKLSDPKLSPNLEIANMPVIIRLGYSIHGNEASGSNASLLVAYHLAAAQGREIDEILKNCIILIDPSLNPDGLQRFSTWVNEHKSKNLNPDPNSREFSEAWPGGRTNHYWFDLNRDWLLAQHPESIGRLKLYHNWKPNVQTDHHEMGSDATFFFQPGVPSRKHPLIPEKNVTLTESIAIFHAKALNKYKRLYYSKESFDDFYFGKGSTYPDIHGSIGILFEQASVRGHLRETQNGTLTFPFAIKNHFIVSLSTIEAANNLKDDLLNYQRDFYINSANDKIDKNRAIIIGTKHDPARTILLGQVLLKHQIEIYKPTKDIKLGDNFFNAANSIVIPLDQKQNKLIKAIFERRTTFQDSLFYDISAWNFDLAYNAEVVWIENKNSIKIQGEQINGIDLPKGEIIGNGTYAYAMDWDQYFAPGLVYGLLDNEIIVKVASEPFTSKSGKQFERGSILIPIGIQEKSQDELSELLKKYTSAYHLKVYALESGLSSFGIDIGSINFKVVRKPSIALIIGNGVNSYSAGEVWHLLDQRYDMPVSLISNETLDKITLGRYNTLVLSGGSYSNLNANIQKKIKQWVQNGGTLIAWNDALRFVAKLQIADVKIKKAVKDTTLNISYADQSKAKGAQVIGGAIFNMEIDNTHPLAYGYDQKTLPVFKKGTLILEPAKKSIANPFKYVKDPLLSGYVSKENLKNISGSPAVSISTFGKGKIIAFTDNHNFRAFWYGTNRLFINSLLFGDKISTK